MTGVPRPGWRSVCSPRPLSAPPWGGTAVVTQWCAQSTAGRGAGRTWGRWSEQSAAPGLQERAGAWPGAGGQDPLDTHIVGVWSKSSNGKYKVEITNWWWNDQLVIFNCWLVFLGLGKSPIPNPKNTNPYFKINHWSFYYQLVISTFCSLMEKTQC